MQPQGASHPGSGLLRPTFVSGSGLQHANSAFSVVPESSTLLPQIPTNAADFPFAAIPVQGNLLRRLSVSLVDTFRKSSPHFRYSQTLNPRRVLTKPSEPVGNDNYDNCNSDYILYVNDQIGTFNQRYRVVDMLGQGTFGQVVKCIDIHTNDHVAIKIVKNKPAYFNQGLIEISILEMLNHQFDPDGKHHIVRLQEYFIHRNHLCLVFELLNLNLYDLIRQNQFRGLSLTLIRCFMILLLDALKLMYQASVIHCDMKPENILLENSTSPSIKIIDFGSACFENHTVFTYIQSRFYRSPEVLIGLPYGHEIDMWSLGCIAAELFLGLPLFPGSSEFNQIFKIIDMLGPIPVSMLDKGNKTSKYFNKLPTGTQLKTDDQYYKENNQEVQPSKKYFKYRTLHEIIEKNVMKDGLTPDEVLKEKESRRCFAHFLEGCLKLDPEERWTPEQASSHPFIKGTSFTGSFVPETRRQRVTTPPRPIPWGITGDLIGQGHRAGFPGAGGTDTYAQSLPNAPFAMPSQQQMAVSPPFAQPQLGLSPPHGFAQQQLGRSPPHGFAQQQMALSPPHHAPGFANFQAYGPGQAAKLSPHHSKPSLYAAQPQDQFGGFTQQFGQMGIQQPPPGPGQSPQRGQGWAGPRWNPNQPYGPNSPTVNYNTTGADGAAHRKRSKSELVPGQRGAIFGQHQSSPMHQGARQQPGFSGAPSRGSPNVQTTRARSNTTQAVQRSPSMDSESSSSSVGSASAGGNGAGKNRGQQPGPQPPQGQQYAPPGSFGPDGGVYSPAYRKNSR
eukprot:TRINITY_DN2676_c1_g1_i3.p1 TRINITY_DN2676_c1_g1~~TRINITY_DN2676_c1_g1_i3.p1  ORF type:complete len:784 (-),score=185.19 TRINITY_DN2676_c1_g1_i3:137-2488(-)